MSVNSSQWTGFLCQPDIPLQFPKEDLYHAACIGAVMLLYEASDADGLADAVRHASAPESRARALLALESLTRAEGTTRETAVRLLHELAVLDGIPDAGNFLQKSNLQDSDPGWNSARMLLLEQKHQLLKADPGPEHLTELFLSSEEPLRLRLLALGGKLLPNWTALMRFMDDPSEDNRLMISDRFHFFTPEERRLISHCAAAEDKTVNSLPADLFVRYEDETLQKLCVTHHLLPLDPSQQALFYFLSGQWERYYASDSDYRRIRIAYEQKGPELQRRLITVSRDSGNSAWLREISGSLESAPHGGSLSDQHLFAASLISQKQWGKLWEILPSLPLLCMPPVMKALKDAGFQPRQTDENIFFEELAKNITAFEGLSPVPVKRTYLESGGTGISICGSDNYFAVIFSDKRILVWDKRSGSAEPIRITSSHLSFRKAVISHDGKYICADCGKDGITVFTLPGGQAVKTIPVSGSGLSGLYLQPDDRRLITMGTDGKGKVYSFPGGIELRNFDTGLKECALTAYNPYENRICAVSAGGTGMLYDIADQRLVSGVRLSENILSAAETLPFNKLAFIEKNELLSVINILSGKFIIEKTSLSPVSVRRILPLAENSLYVLGTLDGQVRIFDPVLKNYPVVLSFGSKSAVTGIWLDEKESVLYGCSASGTVCSWDLGLFGEMIRNLPLLQLPGFNRIDEFVKKYPEPGVKAAAAWLKSVTAWRRRFDIEVDFDIE